MIPITNGVVPLPRVPLSPSVVSPLALGSIATKTVRLALLPIRALVLENALEALPLGFSPLGFPRVVVQGDTHGLQKQDLSG